MSFPTSCAQLKINWTADYLVAHVVMKAIKLYHWGRRCYAQSVLHHSKTLPQGIWSNKERENTLRINMKQTNYCLQNCFSSLLTPNYTATVLTKAHMTTSIETLPAVYLKATTVSGLCQMHIKFILNPSERVHTGQVSAVASMQAHTILITLS